MKAKRRQNVGLDDVDHRLEGDADRAHPVGHRRDIDLDAFAGKGTALPMQRQMQAELAEGDLGQQHRTSAPSRNWV